MAVHLVGWFSTAVNMETPEGGVLVKSLCPSPKPCLLNWLSKGVLQLGDFYQASLGSQECFLDMLLSNQPCLPLTHS